MFCFLILKVLTYFGTTATKIIHLILNILINSQLPIKLKTQQGRYSNRIEKKVGSNRCKLQEYWWRVIKQWMLWWLRSFTWVTSGISSPAQIDLLCEPQFHRLSSIFITLFQILHGYFTCLKVVSASFLLVCF